MEKVGALLLWFLGGGFLAFAGLAAVAMLWHIMRLRRVSRAYQSLPEEVKHRVLGLIEEAASARPSVTFLRLDPGRRCEDEERDAAVRSHVGGAPYMERGEAWPAGESVRFLLQLLIDEPGLGERRQGRLVTVFMESDYFELSVRSHADPSILRYVPASGSVAPEPCVPLIPLRYPMQEAEERVPATPAALCQMVPEIAIILGRTTSDAQGLLAQVLRPDWYVYDLAMFEIAYEGGEPLLIQNPHDPVCDICGDRMRFLFQFGEVISGVRLADGGVGYVYGCDEHPDHCKGFLDTH
jgi:hypothetical protein